MSFSLSLLPWLYLFSIYFKKTCISSLRLRQNKVNLLVLLYFLFIVTALLLTPPSLPAHLPRNMSFHTLSLWPTCVSLETGLRSAGKCRVNITGLVAWYWVTLLPDRCTHVWSACMGEWVSPCDSEREASLYPCTGALWQKCVRFLKVHTHTHIHTAQSGTWSVPQR